MACSRSSSPASASADRARAPCERSSRPAVRRAASVERLPPRGRGVEQARERRELPGGEPPPLPRRRRHGLDQAAQTSRGPSPPGDAANSGSTTRPGRLAPPPRTAPPAARPACGRAELSTAARNHGSAPSRRAIRARTSPARVGPVRPALRASWNRTGGSGSSASLSTASASPGAVFEQARARPRGPHSGGPAGVRRPARRARPRPSRPPRFSSTQRACTRAFGFCVASGQSLAAARRPRVVPVHQQPLGRVALPAVRAVERGDEAGGVEPIEPGDRPGLACRPGRRGRSAPGRCRRGGRSAPPSRRGSTRGARSPRGTCRRSRARRRARS